MSDSVSQTPFDVALSRANTDGWIEVTYSELQWFAEEYRLHYYARDGVVTMPFDQFCTEQDLENWRQLIVWWPRVPYRNNAPPFQPMLTLMLDAQHGAPTLPPVTFAHSLRTHWERAVAWCQLHGVDTSNPNESADERSKRLNRERVAAWRAAKKVEQDPTLTEAVVNARQAYAQAVEDAKAHYGPLIDEATAKVAEAYAWFIAKSRERKDLREQLKTALAQLKGAHDNGPVAQPADALSDVDHS